MPGPTASGSSSCSAGCRPSTTCRACRPPTCCAAIDPERYDVVPIGIAGDGRWVLADDAKPPCAPAPPALPATVGRPRPARRSSRCPRSPRPSDDLPVVVLPLLHGPHGEDGTVQGMLELAGVPYVGSGVLARRCAWTRRRPRSCSAAAGLPQVPLRRRPRRRARRARRRAAEAAGLGLPGVREARQHGLVGRRDQVRDRRRARRRGRPPRPTTTSGSSSRRPSTAARSRWACSATPSPAASVPGEIVPSHEFYDYDDKYVDGACELLDPGRPAAEVGRGGPRLAVDAFRALRCDGSPGSTSSTRRAGAGLLRQRGQHHPRVHPGARCSRCCGRPSGLPYPELIDELVRLARRAPRAPQPLLDQALTRSAAVTGAHACAVLITALRLFCSTSGVTRDHARSGVEFVVVSRRSGPPRTRGGSSPWGQHAPTSRPSSSSSSPGPPWDVAARPSPSRPSPARRPPARGRVAGRSPPAPRRPSPRHQVAEEVDLTTVVPALEAAFGARYGGFGSSPHRTATGSTSPWSTPRRPTTPHSSPSSPAAEQQVVTDPVDYSYAELRGRRKTRSSRRSTGRAATTRFADAATNSVVDPDDGERGPGCRVRRPRTPPASGRGRGAERGAGCRAPARSARRPGGERPELADYATGRPRSPPSATQRMWPARS